MPVFVILLCVVLTGWSLRFCLVAKNEVGGSAALIGIGCYCVFGEPFMSSDLAAKLAATALPSPLRFCIRF